jgi:hypothetical protein
MANPYIFTTGTCTKKDIYGIIKSTMIAAGWTNISSNAATDFDVLSSMGKDGTKNLVIQMRATNTTGANDTTTTDYCLASYRLINSYTPGAPLTAGIVGRTAETWNALSIAPGIATDTISKDTPVTYRYYADASKLIMQLEYPVALGKGPVVLFIGLPDTTYCSEPNSRGLLVASSANANTANSVHITDQPGELAATTASSVRGNICNVTYKNPNSAGKYLLAEIFYGNATEGVRGKLDGLYAIPNQNVLNGDNIVIGTETYYVAICNSTGNNGLPSLALTFRIS